MEKWRRAIDQQIEDARKRGDFENLKGKGKPLNFEKNPYENPEMRAAHRMLRENGYSLPWIEDRKRIERDYERARRALERSWRWYRGFQALGENSGWVEREWKRAVKKFREAVEGLNRRIANHNLSVPNTRFEKMKINADRVIEKIQSDL